MSGEIEPPTPPAASWGRRFVGDWLPRAALESFLIVLSLLGALWLNDWNADRQRDQRVAEARAFLVEEVKANQAELARPEIHPHHVKLARALQAYGETPNPTKADRDAALEVVFATGIHPASFRDAVWRSVQAGDLLQYMKPREVFALSQLYRRQEELIDINRAMYGQLVNADPDSEDQGDARKLAQSLRLYMADVIGSEQQLAGDYAATLRQMGAAPEPNGPKARK